MVCSKLEYFSNKHRKHYYIDDYDRDGGGVANLNALRGGPGP
jgi:hypothetical protein